MIKKKKYRLVILGIAIILAGIFLFSLLAQGISITLNDGTIINLPDTEFEPSQWVEKEIKKK
ncbi:unnamed protein product [marine sediment metagenome]|uniref:Uncharacterized protein n=1 Tax=marine sediment metagenome TaxID=412755 RepID=X1HMJ8_9ZZZZ